jgi:hypothetical protein
LTVTLSGNREFAQLLARDRVRPWEPSAIGSITLRGSEGRAFVNLSHDALLFIEPQIRLRESLTISLTVDSMRYCKGKISDFPADRGNEELSSFLKPPPWA